MFLCCLGRLQLKGNKALNRLIEKIHMAAAISGKTKLSKKEVLEQVLRCNKAIPDVIHSVAERSHSNNKFLRIDMAAVLLYENPLDLTEDESLALSIGYLVVDTLYCELRTRNIINYSNDFFSRSLLLSDYSELETTAGFYASRIQRLLYKIASEKMYAEEFVIQHLVQLSEKAEKAWAEILKDNPLLVELCEYPSSN